MTRYAIFYSPSSQTRLGMLGARWLGWDVDSNTSIEHPDVPQIPADRVAAITAAARRYSWHATLKAPFALAPGRTVDELKVALAAFTRVRESSALPPLRVSVLSGFIALVAQTDAHGLATFAMDVVRAFDRFRAPLDSAEITRRRKMGLNARQDALLLHWGYPFVMDEYRFHMTLTEPIDDTERQALMPFLESWFAPAITKPGLMTDVALLEEAAPGAQFTLVERFVFGKSG